MSNKHELAKKLRKVVDQIGRGTKQAELVAVMAEQERRRRELDKLVKFEIERIEREMRSVVVDGKISLTISCYRDRDVVERVLAWGREQGFTVSFSYVPEGYRKLRWLKAYFVLTFSW